MLKARVTVIAVAALAALLMASYPFGASWAAGNELKAPSSVEVTIYNSDLALIKDRRTLSIPEGASTLMFPDIPSQINPATVSFQSLTHPGAVRVREQNYEYDLVEDSKLLQKFIGEKITVRARSGEVFTGYLLSGVNAGSPSNIVLSSKPGGNGSIVTVHLDDVQSVEYPSLPDGLITRPTLAWLVNNSSKSTSHDTMVTYLTGGLSWSADYVAVIGPNDDTMDITGWITLNNQSGATYKDAKVKLVAGDVNRVQPEAPEYARAMAEKVLYAVAADSVEEREFADYHLYQLQYPTTLKENQQKQVEFMSAADAKVKKIMIFDGSRTGTKVASMLEFWNNRESGLGMPLPKGVIRVSKADTDGSLEFVGEDRIDHTPVDEKLRITLGYAFDVVGQRTQVSSKRISDRVREETWKVEVRNRKGAPVEVSVVEHMWGGSSWSMVSASSKYTELDATTVEFPMSLEANSTASITYTVRYSN